MSGRVQRVVDELTASQGQIVRLLESVAGDQDWQSAPDDWSFRYIAAHLATVEEDCFLDRVTRIAAGESPYFDYYHHDGWDFSHLDLRDSLQSWIQTRRDLVDVVMVLPAEKFSFSGTHVKFGPMTIRDTLQLMLDHDIEHLEDLTQTMMIYK